jgi:hypothetical protein
MGGQNLYAADILFLAGHCAAKLSDSWLMKRLSIEDTYKKLCYGALGIASLWGVSSILAIALQCGIAQPRPWQPCKSAVGLRLVSSIAAAC